MPTRSLSEGRKSLRGRVRVRRDIARHEGLAGAFRSRPSRSLCRGEARLPNYGREAQETDASGSADPRCDDP
jgi:hypothetical protein